jgi:hypothetical protein
MTQALYAHMNNKNKQTTNKQKCHDETLMYNKKCLGRKKK